MPTCMAHNDVQSRDGARFMPQPHVPRRSAAALPVPRRRVGSPHTTSLTIPILARSAAGAATSGRPPHVSVISGAGCSFDVGRGAATPHDIRTLRAPGWSLVCRTPQDAHRPRAVTVPHHDVRPARGHLAWLFGFPPEGSGHHRQRRPPPRGAFVGAAACGPRGSQCRRHGRSLGRW